MRISRRCWVFGDGTLGAKSLVQVFQAVQGLLRRRFRASIQPAQIGIEMLGERLLKTSCHGPVELEKRPKKLLVSDG